MIFDSTNLFSDAQAVTASAVSTNVIDLGPTKTPQHGVKDITRDIGKGTPIYMRAQVVEAFATLTSLTLTLQTSVDEAFTSPQDVLASPAAVAASLLPGYVFPLTVVPRGTLLRYVRLSYTVGGANATAGAVTAGFVFGNEERDV